MPDTPIESEEGRIDEIVARYDANADAAYVEIVPGIGSMGTERVSPGVLLDLVPGPSGWSVIGIELLNPHPRPRLAAIADEHGFAHLLDDIYAVLDMALGANLGGKPCSTTARIRCPRPANPPQENPDTPRED